MGSKKSKSTTKPVYSSQIEGAAGNLNSVYNSSKDSINQVSSNLTGLSSDLLGRFQQGDPTITAAKGYITDTLAADPASNPYLDDMISMSNDSVRNQLQAQMGTRGLTGSSDYYGLISKNLANNETGLRYTDYNNTLDRQAQAAGMAPSIVAGEYIPVAAAMEAGTTGAMLPTQAALANAAGVGGLLGQYTNSTQKQSGGFGSMLGGIVGAGLSGWASGGFKGI
ncbi:hypothetical protein [Croceicoccus sp. Ery15]|uniref:hypothetical protein n=1 Tax=Croceicoccus sp. Ery15 TaxID=1703338 RepID=UPI001E5FEC00|nr:hypothetical protein [Croceicoccus sp. Ery15]